MVKIKDLCKHISWKEAVVVTLLILSIFVFAGCSVPTVDNSKQTVSQVNETE